MAPNRLPFLLILASLAVGCTGLGNRPLPATGAPGEWARGTEAATTLDSDWLTSLGEPELVALVGAALDRNLDLAAAEARLAQAEEAVVTARAPLLPSLSLSLDNSRRRIITNFTGDALDNGILNEIASSGLDLRWQLDIWGELRAATRQAVYDYGASEASYLDTRQQLAADVVRAWYGLAEARELRSVAQRQLDNAQDSLQVVERAYTAGLNEALDVYLARTTVAQAEDNLATRAQQVLTAAATLQLLIADYPDGTTPVAQALPEVAALPGLGVPGELIARRPDLQLAWLNLLSADAALAVAQRQRFPSLVVTAGLTDQGPQISDTLDGNPLGWSVFTQLTQPLFQAGALRANQRRAAARVQELEATYLQQVNLAFAEVENAVSNAAALERRYTAAVANRDSANDALDRALAAYERGLGDYLSVLESQRRAFDARTNIVLVRAALLRNRIDLYEALGGPFAAADARESTTS